MPETLVIKATAELTNVLKGTVSRDIETAEALQKSQQPIHKNCSGKSSNNKGTRTTNSPHVAPTRTTSMGG
jgi:hypothetical protein